MAVARRAETYIRRESAPRILHLAPRRVNAASGRRTESARLGAGLVDVVDGGARASGLGFMRPSYFASCEPVIPGRAGDLWPRCVPPAPLILPFRPESNFHLSSTPPPLPVPPPSLLRYLNPVYTLFRVRMSGRQRELISSFRRLVRRLISPPSFDFLPFPPPPPLSCRTAEN